MGDPNIIYEHKYFRLTGCLHCDQMCFPRIFPGAPSYLSTPSAVNRSSPSKRRKAATKRHNELQSEWQNKDLISSYDVLKSSIVEHLRVIQATTNVKLCEDHVGGI